MLFQADIFEVENDTFISFLRGSTKQSDGSLKGIKGQNKKKKLSNRIF